MEQKKKEKRTWPIYIFLTIIIILLFFILCSIYSCYSVFYSWPSYSLQESGYFDKNDNTIGNELIINNTIIDATPSANNTVE